MDRPSALAAEGLPYVFDRFRQTGRIPPLDDSLVATVNAGEPVPVDRAGAGPRRVALPRGRDVVSFAPLTTDPPPVASSGRERVCPPAPRGAFDL